eukprot:scaffold18788_cov66-Cyclotella_meneghiniana.AAC.1
MAKSAANNANAGEEIPKLFTKDIYNDFQSALLKLEKRVSQGRGALTSGEVHEFELETGRIVEEMKDPEGMKSKIATGYASTGQGQVGSNPTASTTPTIQPATSPPLQANISRPPTSEVATKQQAPASRPQITDLSEDEGPSWDGEGGFGLARGTTNTYVIPGMDEMTPEEYREKLQASVSARQAKRREEAMKSGIIGNRSSNGYLDTLSRGGSQGEHDDVEKKWRSDSVRMWMDALVKDNNIEMENNLVPKDDESMPSAVESSSRTEATNSLGGELVQPKPESVIEFASSLKQGKTEKELYRKSEWQTETTMDALHEGGSQPSQKILSPTLEEEKQWFSEKRQRPVPSSIPPEYSTVDKYVGDASKQSTKVSVTQQRSERGWYNEKKRVRPTPNSEPAERPKISNRTGAPQQDRSSISSEPQLPAEEGWFNEKRVRPNPNTVLPERPLVFDRTGTAPDTTPRGPVRNSFLRSLLNDAPPSRTTVRMQTVVSSTSSEVSHWWKNDMNRPKDYVVRSNALLHNTYEEREDSPKNYGDIRGG